MENQKKDIPAQPSAVECRGCPYPSTGFLCGGSDGECMKTRVRKIKDMASKGGRKSVCD